MLKVAWNPCFSHPLPEGHRFPMEKYALLVEQLLYDGTLTNANFFDPSPVSTETLKAVHSKEYVENLLSQNLSKKEIRAMGFPLSPALVEREFRITGGTVQAVDFAMKYGVAGNIAGGTHHAFRDRGEGFCLFNDIAVAAHYAMDTHKMKRILVIDLDVHQGNGTASIFQSDPRVFTCSMHGGKNYPLHKENSDLDIPLNDGTGDDEYIQILNQALPKLIADQNPELIFYLCGVDVLASDKLGRLGLSVKGCKERDQIVFKTAQANQIPIVFSMGGGYSDKISVIVEAHANTYRLAQEIYF